MGMEQKILGKKKPMIWKKPLYDCVCIYLCVFFFFLFSLKRCWMKIGKWWINREFRFESCKCEGKRKVKIHGNSNSVRKRWWSAKLHLILCANENRWPYPVRGIFFLSASRKNLIEPIHRRRKVKDIKIQTVKLTKIEMASTTITKSNPILERVEQNSKLKLIFSSP